MPIKFIEQTKTFHLFTKNSSYLFKLLSDGRMIHLYYGTQILTQNMDYMMQASFNGNYFAQPNSDNSDVYFSVAKSEYPSFGNPDMRSPAIEIQQQDGSRLSDFRYQDHRIFDAKPKLKGLPCTHADSSHQVQTLEITLLDEINKLKLVLLYTVFADHDAIARSAHLINNGSSAVWVNRLFSASLDFEGCNFQMLSLNGAWVRECNPQIQPLHAGTQSIESRVGASSNMHNPMIALMSPSATESTGEVYGLSLVYSGNFFAGAEVDFMENTRLQIGLSPFQFHWKLNENDCFQSPEAIMIYSSSGIGSMSRKFHHLYRAHLIKGDYSSKPHPVVLNSWEAAYFDFDGKKLKSIAKRSAELGADLFVLDDGWFGERNSDNCSLGDWVVNEKKLGQSLFSLSSEIESYGIKFGLWFEPEMISPNSNLYRKHPDWCLHVKNRKHSLSRNQLVLDLTRKEICNYIMELMRNILKNASISYVKWDMNRYFTEIGSPSLPAQQQGEVAHRYMLNLYNMIQTITSEFPHILFESCAGGGGRFDPGMLYYMPQAWTSDDTDAIERLKIQFGTSIVYPPCVMACHVSAVPNHQTGRTTPLTTRAISAMMGQFGYELNPLLLSDEEKSQVKKQIKLYKSIQTIIQFGDLYRLQNPWQNQTTAWCIVSNDKRQAVVSAVANQIIPNKSPKAIRLQGLISNKTYEITHLLTTSTFAKQTPWIQKGACFTGSELMSAGLPIPIHTKDYDSTQWVLKIKE